MIVCIHGFRCYDRHGHLTSFDSGIIEKNKELFFSCVMKHITEEDPSPEGMAHRLLCSKVGCTEPDISSHQGTPGYLLGYLGLYGKSSLASLSIYQLHQAILSQLS